MTRRGDARLLDQLAPGGVHRLLAGQQEAARQGGPALEGRQGPVHQEDVEPVPHDRQGDDVDGDRHQQRRGRQGRGGGLCGL